jgi:uncharacterized protein YndB with AHSA1/START domain
VLAGLGALLLGRRPASAQSCPPGQTANRKGECRCPAGTDACPGGCVDRKRDPNNCGSCGNVCFSNEVCRKGECRCNCGPGFDCVAGECSPSEQTGMTFNAPVAEVWQALTNAETLTSLGISSDIVPRVGQRFQVRPASGSKSVAAIEAEVIAVDAPRQFAFKWLNGPLDEPTTVTITLDSEADGAVTRFRMAHTDPSGASCKAGALVLGRNWGQRFLKDALPSYLAQRQTR